MAKKSAISVVQLLHKLSGQKRFTCWAILILLTAYTSCLYAQTKLLTTAMTPVCLSGCQASPGNGVTNVLDRNINTKFRDPAKVNTGFYVNTNIDSRVTKIELTTADDSPESDPSGFVLLGSNDGSNWDQLYQGNVPCNSPRLYTWGFTFTNFKIFSWYRIQFTGLCNTLSAKSMQVAEVQLYRSSITLPIKLLSFYGTVTNHRSTLFWNLAQPEEFARFEIEQSTNGQQFTSLDTIIKSHLFTSFSFIAKNSVSGIQYYRLKTTEKSGEVTYSQVIVLRANVPNTSLRTFPNPVKKGETAYVTGYTANAQSWVLYNLAGVMVSSGYCNPASLVSIPIATGTLKGMYLLHLKANATKSVIKLMVD